MVVAVPAALMVLAPAAAFSLTSGSQGWASGLAGCDPAHPAVAHHADQHLLSPQPSNGPVPCGISTGWPTVENKIEVTNSGTLIYEPALQGGPVLAGDGHVPGWGTQFGFARSSDQGGKWQANNVQVSIDDHVLDNQVDNNLYVDHATGRFFWYMYDSGTGTSKLPYYCSNGKGATVAFSDDSGTTWNWGYDIDHACSENPTVLTAKPRTPGTRSYPNTVYLCGDNASTGAATIGTLGFSCSKSLDGGRRWLGTTLGGQAFYSGLARDHLHPYPQCAGQSTSAGAGVQPLPDGTLLVVVTCNGNTFLSRSRNEGATWNIAAKIPHGGSLRADSAGNLYLLEKATANGADQLLLSHSSDGGKTWSPELNMVAPGVTSVGTYTFAQGTYAAGLVGDVAVTYYGIRTGKTVSDGFISATKDAINANPVFWSGQVNTRSGRPLLYNTQTSGNIGITVLDFNGGAWSPDGVSVWGSWVQDCGANALTDPNCTKRLPKINPANPDDGFAGRLVWPPLR
jgi:hypothetical protein